MSAAATVKASSASSERPAAASYVDKCPLPGAAIDIGVCPFRPMKRGANLHFALLLSEVTGRLEPSGAGGYCREGRRGGVAAARSTSRRARWRRSCAGCSACIRRGGCMLTMPCRSMVGFRCTSTPRRSAGAGSGPGDLPQTIFARTNSPRRRCRGGAVPLAAEESTPCSSLRIRCRCQSNERARAGPVMSEFVGVARVAFTHKGKG